MYTAEHIQLFEELRKEAEAKTAGLDPQHLKMLLTGAGGMALGAIPAALIGNHYAEKAREQTRNRAFGAGLATGVAAPHILRRALNFTENAGLLEPAQIPQQQPQLQPLYDGGGQ